MIRVSTFCSSEGGRIPHRPYILRDTYLRTCLHGGGGPQTGEVTCGGSPHLKCKRDQIKMRDYMDRHPTEAGYLTYLGSTTSM